MSRRLRALIEDTCGLELGPHADAWLERRLGPRLRALGLDSDAAYCDLLRDDPSGAELDTLIERIVLLETYLFREQHQLDEVSETILPELAQRHAGARRLRIWSAGCSTGEEAYTLAIVIDQSGLFEGWDVEVLGTDISRRALRHARAAVYGETSFRTTSAALRETYFTAQDQRWRVRDDIRAMCRFEHSNLLDSERVGQLGAVDLILCRNLLAYLTATARAEVVAALHRQCSPDGYLLLGHAEGLLRHLGRSPSR